MATNKQATIRYFALDRCFSNHWRKYFIEDLIEYCNKALLDFSGIEAGVSRRQVFDDIKFMESEQGWSIPLRRHKEGRRVYYRYTEKTFSIKNLGIDQDELEQIRDSLTALNRFQGLPQFEWVDEILIRFEETFQLGGTSEAIVGFDQNPYLRGLTHFTPLYGAIVNSHALDIDYQGFLDLEPKTMCIHPWYLKQYNNRWFLFGYNQQYASLSNLALDRIQSIRESSVEYMRNTEVDFEEYFEDVIGVTVNDTEEIERVILKISKTLWPYIQTKPIHGSQKILERTEKSISIELKVQINYELISTIFTYIDGLEVIEPLSLRTRVAEIISKLKKIYS